MKKNMSFIKKKAYAGLLSILISFFVNKSWAWGVVSTSENLVTQPALAQADPSNSMILSATKAGGRIVAVGELGTILLSDDGAHYRQAEAVPVGLTLNSVFFIDETTGWAAGHGGVILRTEDGGEHWQEQRIDIATDQPLFSIYFKDKKEGWAVGLWSLALHTQDGGETWDRIELPLLPGGYESDLNMFHVFAADAKRLFVTCERGMILRSLDGGKSWQFIQTNSQASLWAGVATSDMEIVVGGLRGALLRSDDLGATWNEVDLGSTSSVVSLVKAKKGNQVMGVGLDGLRFNMTGEANSVRIFPLESRLPLTTVVPDANGNSIYFSQFGLVQ